MSNKDNKFNLDADAEIIKEKYNVKLFNNQIWFFDNDKWNNDFSTPILKTIFKEFKGKYQGSTKPFKEIREFLLLDLQNEETPINFIPVINFNNGFMDLDGFKEYKAEEQKRTFKPYMLNFDYEDVKGNKLIDKFLNLLFSERNNPNNIREDVKNFVLAFCFTCFTAYCPKQFLVLTGNGNNGKTTFTKFLRAVNGGFNTAGFSSNKMDSNFIISSFYNKTLALCDDANNEMLEAGTFKQITGQGLLDVERKGENSFSSELNTSLILCSNYNLRYKDNSNAFSSRLNQVALFRDFKGADKDKALLPTELKELYTDKKGFCYFIKLCFNAFKKLWDNNFITIPTELKIIEEELYKENNALYRFLTEEEFIKNHLEDNQFFIYPAFLYDAFKEWYKTNYDKTNCPFSKDGLWKEFKTTMESKLKGFYDFDFSYDNRVEKWVAGEKIKGYVIKGLNFNETLTADKIKELRNDYYTQRRILKTQIENIDDKVKDLNKLLKDKGVN